MSTDKIIEITQGQLKDLLTEEREKCAILVDLYANANQESDNAVSILTHLASAIRKLSS